MKCFYNGKQINFRGAIYVDKNRKKWKVHGSGIRKSPDGTKSCLYLKVKPIEENESKQE